MKKQYFRPYVTGPTIGRVYGKVWTYDGMSWEITPPSDNDSGTSGEGGGNTPSTSTPDNVNYFNVSVQPIQQLLNSTYMGNNKWRLLVRTFSQVTYSWACDDPDAAGIVVVINNPKNPIDGVKYSGSDASFFNSNGTNVIKHGLVPEDIIIFTYEHILQTTIMLPNGTQNKFLSKVAKTVISPVINPDYKLLCLSSKL